MLELQQTTSTSCYVYNTINKVLLSSMGRILLNNTFENINKQ